MLTQLRKSPAGLNLIQMKSPQENCPNVSGTRMIPVNMSNWMGESPLGLNSTQRGKLGAGKVVFPMEKLEYSNWFSSTNGPLCKIHTSSILQTEHMHIYVRNIYA